MHCLETKRKNETEFLTLFIVGYNKIREKVSLKTWVELIIFREFFLQHFYLRKFQQNVKRKKVFHNFSMEIFYLLIDFCNYCLFLINLLFLLIQNFEIGLTSLFLFIQTHSMFVCRLNVLCFKIENISLTSNL